MNEHLEFLNSEDVYKLIRGSTLPSFLLPSSPADDITRNADKIF